MEGKPLEQDAPTIRDVSERMAVDWDARARQNAQYYIATSCKEWDQKDFLASGRDTVERFILSDLQNVAKGDPKGLTALEVGCGIGHVTSALAEVVGRVRAVDVSAEMIGRARRLLEERDNVELYVNNGFDLRAIPDISVDFAFSHLLFQHIPSIATVESYVREVYRVLRAGSLFTFQVQGGETDLSQSDT